MQKLKAGETAYMNITSRNGTLVFVVLVQLFHNGVSLIFNHHAALNRAFTNVNEGRAYLRFVMNEAAAGTPTWLIVDRAGRWSSAAAVADEAEQALIDGINQAMGERHAATNAAHEQARQIRDEAQAANSGGWYATRKQAMRNTIRPTATRIHTQPPTPAQLDRIRRHHNGRVTCAPGQPWTLLRGIVDRGLADRSNIDYKPGTRQIKAIHLNRRGWALLAQQNEVSA